MPEASSSNPLPSSAKPNVRDAASADSERHHAGVGGGGGGGAGARLVDIAQKVGTSRWVVGQVLNGGTGNTRVSAALAEKIRQVAQEMNYRPNVAARLLRSKRSQSYGVMVASAGDPLSSFLVQYLDAQAVKTGCQTLIGNTIGNQAVGPNQFDRVMQELTYRGVDGVFCAVHRWFEGDRSELLRRHRHTVFYEDPGVQGAHFVRVHRGQAVELAVDHLARQGRKRIALALPHLTKPSCVERQQGYRQSLEKHGLAYDAKRVFDAQPLGEVYAVCRESDYRWDFPHQAIEAVIDQLVVGQKADAIVAYDDFWAASLLKQLRRRGVSVPGDVAVVGFLNHYLADWTDPSLTTIDLQHDQAAQAMMAMMDQLVAGQRPEQLEILIEPKLIVRDSA